MKSGIPALFENENIKTIIEIAERTHMGPVYVYKPIIEAWEQDTEVPYLLVTLDKNCSEEELGAFASQFEKEVEQILKMSFGMFPQAIIEQRIKKQTDEETKKVMQERLDCAIRLEDLTNEPLLAQFEKRRVALLEKASADSSPSMPEKKLELKEPPLTTLKNQKEQNGVGLFASHRVQLLVPEIASSKKNQQATSVNSQKKAFEGDTSTVPCPSNTKTALFNGHKRKLGELNQQKTELLYNKKRQQGLKKDK